MSLELTPTQPPYYEIEQGGLAPQRQVFTQSNLINANNNGTNPQTLSQIILPANTVRNIGDWMEWDLFYEFLTGSGTKTVFVRMNATDLLSLNSTAAFTAIWTKFKGIYLGSNLMLMASQTRSGNTNVSSSAWSSTIPFNPTNTNELNLVVTAGIANDIKAQYQTVLINKL